jgi:hypothetical protein
MPPATAPTWTRRALVAASAVVVTGLWLLLETAGVELPPLSRHWPLFVVAGGVASIADWALVSRRAGALGIGVFGLLLGADLYLLTLREVPLRRVGLWGPGVLLAVGAGCLAAWGVDRAQSPRLLTFGVVCVGLAITAWGWGEIPLALFWGLVLLLLGVALVAAVVRSRRP